MKNCNLIQFLVTFESFILKCDLHLLSLVVDKFPISKDYAKEFFLQAKVGVSAAVVTKEQLCSTMYAQRVVEVYPFLFHCVVGY